MSEVSAKLEMVRSALQAQGLAAVRLRGVDWFSWMTGGGSSVVLLTAEEGVGDILVTPRSAWALTNTIETGRLADEEIPGEIELWSGPWQEPEKLEAFVREAAGSGKVASDRPRAGELPLPEALERAKRRLLPDEVARYRKLGADAADAMTEALMKARPEWTESELAGEGARAMWARRIHPALTLAAGEERIAKYRHPVPSGKRLGSRAMMVFCGRRGGLYANLTRFVYFREPTEAERRASADCAAVEAAAFAASVPGAPISQPYEAMTREYSRRGRAGEENKHHQGGTTGYRARELVATARSREIIEKSTAIAWNPSLAGAKIEDTVIATSAGIEILTRDPSWPVSIVDGRPRPDLLVRS